MHLSRGTDMFTSAGIVTLMAYNFWFSRGFYEKGFNVWEDDYDVCLLSETKLCLSLGPKGEIKASATHRDWQRALTEMERAKKREGGI